MSPILTGVIASQISGHLVTNNFSSIATVTVGAGGQSTITFSSIPQTYTHLQIRGIFSMSGGGVLKMNYNSDTAANYKSHWLYTDGATPQSGTSSVSPNAINAGYIGSANYFGATIIDILEYTNTNKYKTNQSFDGNDRNGAGDVEFSSGLWMNTNAINTITFTCQSGSFNQNTQLALYGIA